MNSEWKCQKKLFNRFHVHIYTIIEHISLFNTSNEIVKQKTKDFDFHFMSHNKCKYFRFENIQSQLYDEKLTT